jgi:PAS domain S-box-containing protein
MDVVRTSPLWPIGTLLVVLVFVGWGISLVINVERQQEEIGDYISLLPKLTSLENYIHEFHNIIFEESSNRPDGLALLYWRQQYDSYTHQKEAILAEDEKTVRIIYPLLEEIDASVEKINTVFTETLIPHRDVLKKNTVEEAQLHREINGVIERTREAGGLIRTKVSALSVSLISKRKFLYFLIFVSCMMAVALTVILHFYQSDLRKRKRTEAVLRQLTAEFRAMFKSIPDAVFFTDINHEIIMVNPAFCVLFGYQPEEVIGREPYFLFNTKKDYSLVSKMEYKTNNGKLLEPYEIKYRRKNDEIFISESVGSIVKDREGIPFGFMNIIRDISRRKKIEKDLNEAYEKLEQWVNERTEDLLRANDEIKRFAYIVSHDLRAPLVNIKGFAGELRHAFEAIYSGIDKILPHLENETREKLIDILREEIPEALQFIDTSASRMGYLIDAVLKLSRLGRRELHFERINVRVLVQHVLDSLAHQIDQRDITVEIGMLPRVAADRTSMEQIFGNILVNAVNYLVSERKGFVKIGGKRGKHETTFYVRDNGRGIAEEDMPKVFEPFSRAGNPDVPGEGMGLAYVQTLVRRHGGRIWCESEVGSGTTFLFTILHQAVCEEVPV